MNENFYYRSIFPEIKYHFEKSKQITVLTGMRRTGKTTMVKKILSDLQDNNKIFFDLQKLSDQDFFAQRNYDNIILGLEKRGIDKKKKIYIGIDEIQLMPEIIGAIKYLYDHYRVKFILTGSSSYYLKNLFSESLAGRKKIFELYPLSFGEFLFFKNIAFTKNDFNKVVFDQFEYERLREFYEEFVRFGGFPEVVLASEVAEKKDILNDIVSSYVNIDIKFLSDFKEARNIFNLIKMLAARSGTRLDYTKLASLIGLSRHTIASYIELFEKTYLIHRVSVFSNNIDKQTIRAQKVYFSDTGILNVLAELSSGAQFENTVFNQLHHHGELNYFALKTGHEIDFILDKKNAFEVKETPIAKDYSDLLHLANSIKLKKCRLIGRHKSPRFDDYIWAGDIR